MALFYKGYATYINKEKSLDYLHFSENSISEVSNKEELNSATMVISDDYLYETFGIDKPEDYDAIKQSKEEEKQALLSSLEEEEDKSKDHSNGGKTAFKQRLTRFFDLAPAKGAINPTDF